MTLGRHSPTSQANTTVQIFQLGTAVAGLERSGAAVCQFGSWPLRSGRSLTTWSSPSGSNRPDANGSHAQRASWPPPKEVLSSLIARQPDKGSKVHVMPWAARTSAGATGTPQTLIAPAAGQRASNLQRASTLLACWAGQAGSASADPPQWTPNHGNPGARRGKLEPPYVYRDSLTRCRLTKSSLSSMPRPGPSGTAIVPPVAWTFSVVSS